MSSPRHIGEYRLSGKIATGGVAEIYRAESEGPEGFNKTVVIKRILPQFASDPAFVAMFLDEARLVAKLTHPNIAQIYKLGQEEEEFYIAMEWVDGSDLNKILESCRAAQQVIPPPIAIAIMCDVLNALEYAHNFRKAPYSTPEPSPSAGIVTAGIVHRDVTPHNILLSQDGVVKLVDFGVAKAREQQSHTQTGTVKGKFAYMAPEQITGSPVDARTDLFASGIVLFELLTNIKPFGDELAAVAAIQNNDPPDPQTLQPNLPNDLVAILMTALEKDPNHRFPDADDMRRALSGVLRDSYDLISQRELRNFIRTVTSDPSKLSSEPWVSLASPRPRTFASDAELSSSSAFPTFLDVPVITRHLTSNSLSQSSRPSLAFPNVSAPHSSAQPPLSTSSTSFLKPLADPSILEPPESDSKVDPQPTPTNSLTPETSPYTAEETLHPAFGTASYSPTPYDTTSSTSSTDPTSTADHRTRNTRIAVASIAAFFFTLLLISGLTLAVVILISAPQPDENDLHDDPNPSAMHGSQSRAERTGFVFDHPNGKYVIITRKKPVTLYYNDIELGDTPLRTRLLPGYYTVTYQVNKRRYKKSFTITAEDDMSTVFLDRR